MTPHLSTTPSISIFDHCQKPTFGYGQPTLFKVAFSKDCIMRASQKSSALFSALFFLASSAAMAQAPVASETSWTDLTDDASRQKLFDEEIIPAKLKEEQEKPP